MGRGAGLPAAGSGVLTHLPVCAASPGLITSLLPYQMTCLPFLLPSHAVFLPSWSLPQQRSFSFKLPIAPAHPPCLSWAVWAQAGLLGFAVEMFLLRVPPLSTERASCLSPEAPDAGKGARQPCASGSSMSCTCKHHCRPCALGRQVKDRLRAHGLCYLSDSNTRKLNLAQTPLGSPTPDCIQCLLGCSG